MAQHETERRDTFLTERYLIKGAVSPIHERLSSYLENISHDFIRIEKATIVDLNDGQRVKTGSMQLAVREIIFAHELVQVQTDAFRRQVPSELQFVRLVGGTLRRVALRGHVRMGAFERRALGRRFIVLQQPEVDGLPSRIGDEAALIKKLGYLIVNREKVGYLF